MRAEMASLRREIAATSNGFTEARAAQLLEMNERLVARALAALDLATVAARDQAGLTGPGQRDGLTGTPNRALMLDRLRVAIGSARRRGACITVLALRLDLLEDINDAFGRTVGDAALQRVAGRLESAVRESDTRVPLRHGRVRRAAVRPRWRPDARATARRLLSVVTLPARVADREVQLTASLGIAAYPADGDDAAALIGRANAALSPAGTGDGIALEQRCAAPDSAAVARFPVAASPAGVEAAQRHQADFLALVAHELRNPLAPIRLAAEVLARDRRDDPLMARQQMIIKRQVAHMSRLIEDLLDGSRIHTGKLRLDRGTVEMAEVLRLAVEICQPVIDQRAQELTVRVPDAPCYVIGDPVRLVQVFSNLLGNAAKYTPAGGTLERHVGAGGRPADDQRRRYRASASPPTRWPTSSACSSRTRARRRSTRAAWASGWPWCGTSSRPTAAASSPPAPGPVSAASSSSRLRSPTGHGHHGFLKAASMGRPVAGPAAAAATTSRCGPSSSAPSSSLRTPSGWRHRTWRAPDR